MIPSTWTVEAGPFNGPDDPDASMGWVDITGYVNDNLQMPTSQFGRQTDLSTVDPGQFTITVNNQDHRFTPGNPTSPYYPGWRTGMRLRMRETVGSRTFTLADGNLLQPALTIATPGADQTVTVTAVDRIGRLQQSRRFISTLSEWILYNGSGLVAYWPLVDAAGSLTAQEHTGRGTPLAIESVTLDGFSAASSSSSLLAFSGASPPAGDDAQYPQWGPILDVAQDQAINSNRLVCRNLGLTFSGSTVTVVAWVKLDPTNTGTYQVFLLHDAGANTIQLTKTPSSGNPVFDEYKLAVSTGAGSVTLDGPPVTFNTWQLIAVQIAVPTGAVTWWIDAGAPITGSTGGAATGGIDVVLLDSGSPNSSTGQVQIWQDTYTQATHLAQLTAGHTGLTGQYTGQVVRTVALYAGMAAGELSAVDIGSSMMSAVSLAGRAPLDVMRDAEETEQGLLHAYGRQLVFHGRARRLNR